MCIVIPAVLNIAVHSSTGLFHFGLCLVYLMCVSWYKCCCRSPKSLINIYPTCKKDERHVAMDQTRCTT